MGKKRSVTTVVAVKNPAGIFQFTWVLDLKILFPGLEYFIEGVVF
jgi:hypothetical protein